MNLNIALLKHPLPKKKYSPKKSLNSPIISMAQIQHLSLPIVYIFLYALINKSLVSKDRISNRLGMTINWHLLKIFNLIFTPYSSQASRLYDSDIQYPRMLRP